MLAGATTAIVMVLILAVTLTAGTTYAGDRSRFSGLASHYGKGYSGRTAAGHVYDPDKLTAAHRSLPFGTRLRVTNPKTNRSVTVVVNDRGPFVDGRVLDLSLAAAKALGFVSRGVARVTATVE